MDVARCDLDGNADAVEFCPHDTFHNVLAVSTYTLQEGDKPSRTGSISLFNVDADADANIGSLQLVHRVDTAGIFDIRWSPVSANVGPLLAQADADGHVKIHRLESSGVDGNCLKEICGEQVGSSSMCLCIDWNSSGTSIATGLSDGSVSIVSLVESELSVAQEWRAYEFEVWAASFDIHQPNILYTGSDDCKFSCWDLRDDSCNVVFENARSHKMGVCCIAKSPSDPNSLVTGSYDEKLRIWDVRSMLKPISEICLGGGVWRIKHHPCIQGLVLTALMHNGFGVVKMDGDKPQVVEMYNKHASLGYGADWQRGRRKRSVVATCSFYDRLLRVWMPACVY